MTAYRRLLAFAAVLAFGVVALGAWVRLSDAGLGCPDWPGCYGQWLGVPDHAADAGRAWKEMVHRYFAGTLGLCIFGLCALAWRQRPRLSPVLPTTLAGIVVCQALLGMWTVTLLLKPVVVSAHLLGGMTTLALLVSLNLRERQREAPPATPGLRAAGLLALAAVVLQIALGGWVSSNYAALACPDFPACRGEWLPPMDFGHAFTLHRELGQTASGALLALQVGLGIANVLLSLPLPVAVAHNAVAALLLSSVLAANLRLWRWSVSTRHGGRLPPKTVASAA